MHADLLLGGEKIASAPLALIPNRSFETPRTIPSCRKVCGGWVGGGGGVKSEL